MDTSNIDKLTGKEYEFAAACFDMNSIEELSEPHTPKDADMIDCDEWNITPTEWSNAIEAALLDLIEV